MMGRKRRVALALDLEIAVPHHHGVFAGTQRYAAAQPHWECVIDERPFHRQLSGITPFQNYDGVIARATPALARRLGRRGVPLVNTWFQMARAGLPGVYSENVQVGRLAAEHLLERGFRRFGYIGVPGYKGFELVGRAFEQRTEEEGFHCLACQCPRGVNTDPAYWSRVVKSLNAWLDHLSPPVALLVDDPFPARLLISLCRNRGWHVPQNVAILCQYDIKLIAESPPPQISGIDMNFERIGYEAAALLDRLMDGEPPPEAPILIPPKGVIARESTDYFAVEDEMVAEALRYIASHLSEPLSVDRIACDIAAARRSLQRRFEVALGRPVSEEIRRLRLEMAKRLLAEPRRRMNEIARLSGFGVSESMTKVFRREMGMTPTAYRKKTAGRKGGGGK